MASIPELSECDPGIDPVEFNCLILPEPVEEKIGSVFIPDKVKDTDKLAQVRGRLVAASPLAFGYDTWPAEEAHRRPKAGDIVIYAKYAGTIHTGRDGRDYRMLKDK